MLSRRQRALLRDVPPQKRLRVAMALLDLNQSELAEAAKLTQPTICRALTRHQRDIPLSTAAALAKTLGCSIEELFPNACKAAAA